MKATLLLTFLLTCSGAAFGQTASAPPFEELARQFDYDAKAAPERRGPFAAVLFGHWMMEGSPLKNRREFLEEALVLARAGAVSLLIDTPLVRPGFVAEKDEMRGAEQGSEAARQQVVDFRRGLDILLARRDVDPKRVAYVGDAAIRAYFRDYAWDDPVHFVAHSAPAAVFLQFGRKDKPITEKMARRDFARFDEPKRIGFYDAGHELDSVARRERVEWLAERLSLRRPDFDALARIPQLK